MINEHHLVIQSNPLINSRYQLTEIEQKIMRVIISMLVPSAFRLKDQFYRININAFAHLLGRKDRGTSLFKDMRRILKKLKETPITVLKLNGETIEASWIAGFRYPRNKGYLDIEISAMLEPELLQLRNNFTQYHLRNVVRLKGGHTIRIYELILQYANSRTQSREIPIDTLRLIAGLEPNEYKVTRDIFQRIIIPAHKEICTKTDLTFDYRPIKESRQIVAVEFYNIQQKEDIPPIIINLIPEKHRTNKKISQIIRQYIKSHGPEYVSEKLQYVSTRPVKDYAAYLFKALSENYETKPTPELPEFASNTVFEYKGNRGILNGENVIIADNQTLTPPEIAQALQNGTLIRVSPAQLEKECQEKLQKEFEEHRRQKIAEFLTRMPQEDRKVIDAAFLQEKLSDFTRPIFQKGGLQNPVMQALFNDYIVNSYLPDLTFEKYSQKEHHNELRKSAES